MRSCRTASIVASVPLLAVAAFSACRENSPPAASAPAPSAQPDAHASVPDPPLVTIHDLPVRGRVQSCTESTIAVVEGTAMAFGEELGAGDVMLVRHDTGVVATGKGVAVVVDRPTQDAPCTPSKQVVRVASTPELTWAKGAMHARLQVGEKQKSPYYLGRLEGTSAVAEHAHKGTWEILAAVDAAGTLTIDGHDLRVKPRTVALIPPDAKHAWKPDPGSSLRAVQIYFPPGPEQRFVALSAAEVDAGAKP